MEKWNYLVLLRETKCLTLNSFIQFKWNGKCCEFFQFSKIKILITKVALSHRNSIHWWIVACNRNLGSNYRLSWNSNQNCETIWPVDSLHWILNWFDWYAIDFSRRDGIKKNGLFFKIYWFSLWIWETINQIQLICIHENFGF